MATFLGTGLGGVVSVSVISSVEMLFFGRVFERKIWGENFLGKSGSEGWKL